MMYIKKAALVNKAGGMQQIVCTKSSDTTKSPGDKSGAFIVLSLYNAGPERRILEMIRSAEHHAEITVRDQMPRADCKDAHVPGDKKIDASGGRYSEVDLAF